MDLTERENVKTLLGQGAGEAGDHAKIDALITRVSAEVEQYLGREVEAASYTEYLSVEWDGQRMFPLKAWPVTAVTSITWDPDHVFAAADALTTSEYVDPTLSDRGVLVIKKRLVKSAQSLKVVYTGGMAASAAAFVTAYPAIAGMVEQCVVHHLRNRLHVGRGNVSGRGGSVKVNDAAGALLLPGMRKSLRRWKRRAHAS